MRGVASLADAAGFHGDPGSGFVRRSLPRTSQAHARIPTVHVRLDTTQIYTQVSIRMLKQIHSATHPAARLDPKTPETAAAQGGSANKLESDSSKALGEVRARETD